MANSDARKNYRVGTDPAIILDYHLLGYVGSVNAMRSVVVSYRSNSDMRRDQDSVPDLDSTGPPNMKVRGDRNIVAYAHSPSAINNGRPM